MAKNNRNLSEKAAMDGDKTGATVLHATAVYTMKGTEVSDDIIELTDLPPGATVIPDKSHLTFGYPAAFRYNSVSLGDAAAPTRYGYAALNHEADFHSRSFGYVSGSAIAVPQPYKQSTRLVAKFSGTPTGRQAGGKLVFGISYTIKG